MTPTIDIDKLNTILFALLGSKELVNRWWSSPNKAFDNKKPIDVYIDDPKAVSTYIFNQLEAPH